MDWQVYFLIRLLQLLCLSCFRNQCHIICEKQHPLASIQERHPMNLNICIIRELATVILCRGEKRHITRENPWCCSMFISKFTDKHKLEPSIFLVCSVHCIVLTWLHPSYPNSVSYPNTGKKLEVGIFFSPFCKLKFQQYLWSRTILEITRKQRPSEQSKRLGILVTAEEGNKYYTMKQ